MPSDQNQNLPTQTSSTGSLGRPSSMIMKGGPPPTHSTPKKTISLASSGLQTASSLINQAGSLILPKRQTGTGFLENMGGAAGHHSKTTASSQSKGSQNKSSSSKITLETKAAATASPFQPAAIQQQSTPWKVFVRLRPNTPAEQELLHSKIGENSTTPQYIEKLSDRRFDGIFESQTPTTQLFSAIKGPQMVAELFSGISNTLFVYGSFNSGKSRALFGCREGEQEYEIGIVEQAVREMFMRKAEHPHFCSVRISLAYMVQDKAWDLLDRNMQPNTFKIPQPTFFDKFQKEKFLEKSFSEQEFLNAEEAVFAIHAKRVEFAKYLPKIQNQLGPAHLVVKLALVQSIDSGLLLDVKEDSPASLAFIDLSTGSSLFQQHESRSVVASVRALSNVKDFIQEQGKGARTLFLRTLGALLFRNQKVTALLTVSPFSKNKGETDSVLRFGRKIKEYANSLEPQRRAFHKKFSSDTAALVQDSAAAIFKRSLLQSETGGVNSRRSDSLPESERAPSFGLRGVGEPAPQKQPLQALLQKITIDPSPLQGIQEELKLEGDSERVKVDPSVFNTLVSYQPPEDIQTYREQSEERGNVTFQDREAPHYGDLGGTRDLRRELRRKTRLLNELTKNDARVSKKFLRQSEEIAELRANNQKYRSQLQEQEAELANYKNQVEILTMALQHATHDKPPSTQPASSQSSVRKDILSSNLASFINGPKELSRFHPRRMAKHSKQNSENLFSLANDAQTFVTPKIRREVDEIAPPPAPMHPRVSEMLIQEGGVLSSSDSSAPYSRHQTMHGGSLGGDMMGGTRLTLFEEMEKRKTEGLSKRVFNLSQIDAIFQTIKLFSDQVYQKGSETESMLLAELKSLFWTHLLLMSELQTKHQLLGHREAENKDLLRLQEETFSIFHPLAKKYQVLEAETHAHLMESSVWEAALHAPPRRQRDFNSFLPEQRGGLPDSVPSQTGLSTPQPHSRHSSSDIGFYFHNRAACVCGGIGGTESVNSSQCNSLGLTRGPKVSQLLKFKSLDEQQLFREVALQHSKSLYFRQAYESRDKENRDLRSTNAAVNSSASHLVLEAQRELQLAELKIHAMKRYTQELREGRAPGLLGEPPQGDLSPAVIEMSSSSNASSSSTLYPGTGPFMDTQGYPRDHIYELKALQGRRQW